MKIRDEPIRGEEINILATHCYYLRVARLQTSWTEANPLPRFQACAKSGAKQWLLVFCLV
ncbi:hypothetical protein ACE6H2_020376 [Prunus campanulata]